MVVRWFGEPWPSDELAAPICALDEYRVDVPVGERCEHCQQPIEAHDQGVITSTFDSDDYGFQLIDVLVEHPGLVGGGASALHAACDPRTPAV